MCSFSPQVTFSPFSPPPVLNLRLQIKARHQGQAGHSRRARSLSTSPCGGAGSGKPRKLRRRKWQEAGEEGERSGYLRTAGAPKGPGLWKSHEARVPEARGPSSAAYKGEGKGGQGKGKGRAAVSPAPSSHAKRVPARGGGKFMPLESQGARSVERQGRRSPRVTRESPSAQCLAGSSSAAEKRFSPAVSHTQINTRTDGRSGAVQKPAGLSLFW